LQVEKGPLRLGAENRPPSGFEERAGLGLLSATPLTSTAPHPKRCALGPPRKGEVKKKGEPYSLLAILSGVAEGEVGSPPTYASTASG